MAMLCLFFDRLKYWMPPVRLESKKKRNLNLPLELSVIKEPLGLL